MHPHWTDTAYCWRSNNQYMMCAANNINIYWNNSEKAMYIWRKNVLSAFDSMRRKRLSFLLPLLWNGNYQIVCILIKHDIMLKLLFVTWCFSRYRQTANIRRTKSQKLQCFSSRLAVVFVQPIEARCLVENEYVIGAAPTSEGSTILSLWISYTTTSVGQGHFRLASNCHCARRCKINKSTSQLITHEFTVLTPLQIILAYFFSYTAVVSNCYIHYNTTWCGSPCTCMWHWCYN